jgi:hypothetical protein
VKWATWKMSASRADARGTRPLSTRLGARMLEHVFRYPPSSLLEWHAQAGHALVY